MENVPSYCDFLKHSEGAGIEDKISVVETSGGQPQSQDDSLFQELHRPTFGCIQFIGWSARMRNGRE